MISILVVISINAFSQNENKLQKAFDVSYQLEKDGEYSEAIKQLKRCLR